MIPSYRGLNRKYSKKKKENEKTVLQTKLYVDLNLNQCQRVDHSIRVSHLHLFPRRPTQGTMVAIVGVVTMNLLVVAMIM